MWVFEEGGQPENQEKNPQSRDEKQQQAQPVYEVESGNRNRSTLVGSECSHHCAIPAPTMDKGMKKGLVSIETVVLRRWRVETNVWFINKVDNVIWSP